MLKVKNRPDVVRSVIEGVTPSRRLLLTQRDASEVSLYILELEDQRENLFWMLSGAIIFSGVAMLLCFLLLR